MRRAARLDAIHHDAVKALEADGFAVVSLAQLGGGIPDLLVGWDSGNLLLELKTGKRGRLTPDQLAFFARWPGPKAVALSPREALLVARTWRSGRVVPSRAA